MELKDATSPIDKLIHFFRENKFGIFVSETTVNVIVAFILALMINFFITTPNQVKGPSMLPNVEENDFILTNRVKQLIGPSMNWDYERGEVIIFKLPGINPENGKAFDPYIKRIIALPGDEIEIINGKIILNGKQIEEPYLSKENQYVNSNDFLLEGQKYKVPANSYVAMGDNRHNSLDSRSKHVGFVSRDYIIGPATLRIFPFSKFGFVPKANFIEKDIDLSTVEDRQINIINTK